MLRHYSEHGETKFDLASHPKYRAMLLMAQGIATLGNAGKIALMQGNPLASNYVEWMAFIRYLIPGIKYWVFDLPESSCYPPDVGRWVESFLLLSRGLHRFFRPHPYKKHLL